MRGELPSKIKPQPLRAAGAAHITGSPIGLPAYHTPKYPNIPSAA